MAELPFREGLALLETRTRVATISIWSVIASGALAAVGEFFEATGVIDMNSAEPDPLTLLFAFGYMAYFVLLLISFVLVGMWIYRAHANLFAAGFDDLEYTPGWSVGWFFVPIANLFKPFQAMRELWNASYDADNRFGAGTPATVSVWWGAFIVGNILSNVGARIEANAAGAEGVATGLLMGAAGTALTVASAWFLLRIVRKVMEGQRNHLSVSEAFA